MSPYRTYIRFLYATLIALASIATIMFALSGVIGEKEVSGAFLALLATFVGALFAFRLNEEKDKKVLLKSQKAALNRALFILLRQDNALDTFAKHLDPFSTEIDRAFNLPANKPPPYADLTHNFDNLEFLLETEYANVLMQLTIEQERFHQAFESIRLRNEFYVHAVQPALARLQINGKNVTAERLFTDLGEMVFGTAMNGAREVYTHVPKGKISILKMHQELFATAKALFPNEKFIKPAAEA